MTKYLLPIFAFLFFFLPQQVGATAYYIDLTDGASGCGTTGTATTTPFCSLDQFTESARSAGDIAFVRRGNSTTTHSSALGDLNFTSDGTITNPIIITADYNNLWSDFATSSQTFEPIVGSTFLASSASTTEAFPGRWVYVYGDCSENYGGAAGLNRCPYAYEIAVASSTGIELYLPYKGEQSGVGNLLRIMPSSPQWNVSGGNYQWNFDTDNYWYIKGIDVRGTDSNGAIEIDSSFGHQFYDVNLIGPGSFYGINYSDDGHLSFFDKMRISNYDVAFRLGAVDVWGYDHLSDSLIDGFDSGSTAGFASTNNTTGSLNAYMYDSIFRNFNGSGYDIGATGMGVPLYLRNVSLQSPNNFVTDTTLPAMIYAEDLNGAGNNLQHATGFGGSGFQNTFIQSTSSVVRSINSPTSVHVTPSTGTGGVWEFNYIKLFEYPIYSDTSSKQYDVYFHATSTGSFTTNPTSSELWIECEYWAHQTNATSTRKVKKSTGILNFTGSTNWQNLSVVCQPTQTGLLYLNGWYTKPKETGRTNEFFVDLIPVISSP